MTNEKIEKLVRRVCERTIAEELPWEKTNDDNTLQCTFNANVLGFRKVLWKDGKIRYFLDIVGAEGTLLDTFNSESLDEGQPRTPFKDRMAEAFLAARRQAFGVEEVIDDILKDLG